MARRPGGRIPARSARPVPGRSRVCQRTSLPQPAAGRPYAGLRHHAERRDRRHARRPAGDEAQGPSHAGHLQRRRQHDRPGVRRRHLSPRRTGDRRGLDQGIHLAVHGSGDAGPLFRPPAAFELLGGDEDHQGAAGTAGEGPPGAAVPRHGAADRREVRRLQQLPFPRPAVQLPHGPGRGAEAQGDQLHPRRGLSGRRDEARADRPGRCRHAQRLHHAAGAGLRQGDGERRGDQGPRRAGHRRGRRGRHGDGRLADDVIEIPAVERVPAADCLGGSAAAVGVLYRGRRGCDVDKPRNLAKSVTVE